MRKRVGDLDVQRTVNRSSGIDPMRRRVEETALQGAGEGYRRSVLRVEDHRSRWSPDLVGQIFILRAAPPGKLPGDILFRVREEVVNHNRQEPLCRFLYPAVENFGELVLHDHNAQTNREQPRCRDDARHRDNYFSRHAGSARHTAHRRVKGNDATRARADAVSLRRFLVAENATFLQLAGESGGD